MSRRRNRQNHNPQRRHDNSNRTHLRITIMMQADGRIEVDPQFNQAAIEHLDRLYEKAERDDYDRGWDDDHKIAFFQYQVFDEILATYEPPISDADIDPAPGVPSLREAPVREVYDLDGMPRANATPLS